MNNLPKWKQKVIEWLAGDEPVLLNWQIMPNNIPNGMSVIIVPLESEKKQISEYEKKAFIVPQRNVIT